MTSPSSMKLKKALGAAAALSRRKAQSAVVSGRVKIDGIRVHDPATLISAESRIELDGVRLNIANEQQQQQPSRLFRFYKPRGVITTHDDPERRTTVWDVLERDYGSAALPARTISVGRLDLDSEGLLLLTTNGQLARKLEHPSNSFVREYHALVATGRERRITDTMLDELREGLTLRSGFKFQPIHASLLHGEPLSPSSAEASPPPPPLGTSWVRMRLTEGKNREVRRCWEEFGFSTSRLIRTKYGPFELGALAEGQLHEVPAEEVAQLEMTPSKEPRPRDG